MDDLRKALLDQCVQDVKVRISGIEQAVRLVQQSANEDTKSTAGDKYETARAMAQLEMEKLNEQLVEAKKQLQTLVSISPGKSDVVRPGSLVTTNEGTFFIATSLGRIMVDGTPCFVISPQSPIGSRMMGLAAGASFTFNNKSYQLKALL